MKTVLVAVAAWVIGAAAGYLLARQYINALRRRVRELRGTSRARDKPKMGTMDKVLVLEAVILVVYSVAVLVVFWHTGGEPTTLTACVFSVCGLENGVMGWIKTNKDKNRSAAQDPPEPPDVGT